MYYVTCSTCRNIEQLNSFLFISLRGNHRECNDTNNNAKFSVKHCFQNCMQKKGDTIHYESPKF